MELQGDPHGGEERDEPGEGLPGMCDIVRGTVSHDNPAERAAVSGGAGSVTTITLTAGKRNISFFLEDAATDELRYGSSSITSTRGGKLYPGASLQYLNVPNGFEVSFISESGTQTLQVVES